MVLAASLYADQLNSLSISEEQLERLKSMMRVDRVKEHVLKIRATLRRNLQFNTSKEDEGMGAHRHIEARNVYS